MVCALALRDSKKPVWSIFPCATAVCICSSQREKQYCRGKSDLFWGPHCHTTGFQKWNTDISGTFSQSNLCSSNTHVYHALVSIKKSEENESSQSHSFFWRLYRPCLKLGLLFLACFTKHFHFSAAEHQGKRGFSSNLNWKVQLLMCRYVFVQKWHVMGHQGSLALNSGAQQGWALQRSSPASTFSSEARHEAHQNLHK